MKKITRALVTVAIGAGLAMFGTQSAWAETWTGMSCNSDGSFTYVSSAGEVARVAADVGPTFEGTVDQLAVAVARAMLRQDAQRQQ